DDYYASVNGYVGQSNVLNVFDNDLLNGNPVNPVEVILTETVPEPNGYLILNPNGSVDVIAGIPAGTYSLTYMICEVLNPTNCDDAIVTVRVEPPQIIAVEDNATGVNGFAGETDVLNVFDNDLLNGAPVDPFEVTLEETVPEPNGYLVLNPDGSVDVLPGTPAGTYSLIYEICEILNPTNCSDAPVFITVLAAVIAANDDDFSAGAVDCETGGVAGNVLLNDFLDGVAVNSGDVIITLVDDGGITGASIDAAGNLTVPAGVAVGSYLLEYSICETINPTNCDYAFITVVIEDTELPVINCPADVNVNSDPSSCEATNVVIGTPTVNDNCGVNTVTGVRDDMLALTDPYPLGTTTITWTVTDFGGNSATCDQLVVVTDIELPTIVCPAPVAVNTDADECTASGVVLGTPTVDDNCSILSVTNDAPAVFPIGTTTVTWTVTDGSGNIATCEQIVTVTDIELPTIVCPSPVAVNTDADECTASGVVLGTPTVDDNCSILSVTNDAPAVFPIGTTTVTWTVTDGSGNIATCEQIVTVTDIELPTIVCPAPVAVNTDADECTASGVVLGTPTVDDNCSILSVTNDAPAVFPIGTTTVTWTVTDGSGNIATCEQIVTVTDIELPTIVCPAPVAVNTDADECTASGVVLGTPTVDDNCSILSVTNDAPAVFPIGTTTVTWTVTDGSGNIATCEQIVTVTDIELPTIVCPEDIVSCSNVIELVEPLVSDNCGIDQISNNAPVIFPAGTTAVNWIVTDVNGNISSCEQLVHVSLMNVDVEASSQVSCTDASDAVISVTVEGAFGEVTYSLNGGTPQASNIFEGLSAGEYTVLVEDENGCSVLTEEITITNPTQIEAEIIVSSQVSCFDGNDASIEVLATGGTGQFTYSINGGAPQTSNIFENLAAGTHTVVVEDENLCSTTLTDIVIENPEALQVSYTVQDEISCFGSEDGTIEVFVSGGSGVYTVVLTNTTNGQENSLNSSFIFDNLVAGSYTIRVTDSNGCSELINATLQTPEALELSYSPFCEAGIVGIELNANGGLGTPMFSIDGGQSWTESSSFTNLVNGTTLSLIATDANGCLTGIVNVPVESLNTLNASAEVVSENACYGVADAAIQINIVGGVAPYTFTVNGTDVHYSDLIASLNAGDYVIQIRDANECPAVTEISIESSEEIEIDLVSKTNADCNGNSDGTAEIDVSGGFGEFDYNWTNGSTGRIVADLNAGTHTVTVTDLRGCEVTYDVIIESDVIGVELVMNTVFTPNNDGINDHFVISNLEMYPENELVVINRWGNEVYSKKSYDNSWDGSNLTEGTYFYVLKVKMCDEYKTLNGYITILE
ncbi:MAG: HYR domain-containing protein, partial [Bacteroidales bacterium]|nr:HYR domain-containing protein [Bacteroidales bacterium]